MNKGCAGAPALTACAFGSRAGGRTPSTLVHCSPGAMVQEEAKSSDFLPKGQLLQTDQTESCKFSPTSPLKLVRNHILFPVKLPRKTSNWRPRISATEGLGCLRQRQEEHEAPCFLNSKGTVKNRQLQSEIILGRRWGRSGTILDFNCLFILYVICVAYACHGICVAGRGQSLFSLSTIWVLAVRLGSSGSVANAFTH